MTIVVLLALWSSTAGIASLLSTRLAWMVALGMALVIVLGVEFELYRRLQGALRECLVQPGADRADPRDRPSRGGRTAPGRPAREVVAPSRSCFRNWGRGRPWCWTMAIGRTSDAWSTSGRRNSRGSWSSLSRARRAPSSCAPGPERRRSPGFCLSGGWRPGSGVSPGQERPYGRGHSRPFEFVSGSKRVPDQPIA
jgi:hypothetical protein